MRATTLSAAVLLLLAIVPLSAVAQVQVQVGQNDIYTLRWAIPADPGPNELSKDQLARPVMSPDAQIIFRAYSNGRVEKRLTSTGEIQWVRDLNIEVRSALSYQSSFNGQDWIAVVDALGTLHALSVTDGKTIQSLKVGGSSQCAPLETTAGLTLCCR